MNDLNYIQRELMATTRQMDEWKTNGYDTKFLTYEEQLEMYQTRIDNLLRQMKEEMK
jgi:hypothetical protein